MGVTTCDRHGCNNPFCDRYSETLGHICGQCFDELVKRPNTNISEFMASDPCRLSDEQKSEWITSLNKEFKELP